MLLLLLYCNNYCYCVIFNLFIIKDFYCYGINIVIIIIIYHYYIVIITLILFLLLLYCYYYCNAIITVIPLL